MLYESNELIYFHVIKPEKVSYVFKAKPAQDFGDVFVSCILFSRKIFKAEVLKVPTVYHCWGFYIFIIF